MRKRSTIHTIQDLINGMKNVLCPVAYILGRDGENDDSFETFKIPNELMKCEAFLSIVITQLNASINPYPDQMEIIMLIRTDMPYEIFKAWKLYSYQYI